MSLASEMQTLSSNKTSIKAAIVAKNPPIPPTDNLSQWSTAIQSIPNVDSTLSEILNTQY